MCDFWVRCTINRSHSTPCKNAAFEYLQICSGHCFDFFLPVSSKICHSPIKKVKRQPTLIISFSQHSLFFEGQSKNSGWSLTGAIRYLVTVLGSLWQNSPHKDAFFCINLTNIDQCWITCTFKVEKTPIYAIKGPETASAKFLKVLFSRATKPEDCICVLTPQESANFRIFKFCLYNIQTHKVKQKNCPKRLT